MEKNSIEDKQTFSNEKIKKEYKPILQKKEE